MNAATRMSEKGQVVVPKDVRDRMGWLTGTDLEVVEMADGVLLRPRSERKGLTMEEALAKLRKIYTHKGPPVPLEEMSLMAQEQAKRGFDD